MHRSRRYKDQVAVAYFAPLEKLFDFSRLRGFVQSLGRERLAESHGDFARRLGIEHVPGFGFP
jgi:hypothetical protein